MLKLKFQYSATWCKELTHWKRPMSHWKWWKVMGKDQWCWEKLKVGGEGDKEKGTTEDEMVGCHHWLNGHEFGWTPELADGQEDLACCGSWGCKESDRTEQLNWTELNIICNSPSNYSLYLVKSNNGLTYHFSKTYTEAEAPQIKLGQSSAFASEPFNNSFLL